MGFFLISHVRGGLIRRAASPRPLYAVPALPRRTDATPIPMKEALQFNETGVLTSMRDHPYRALSFLKRIERNGALPSVQAYAAVIRILCICGIDKKLDPLLVELVRKGEEARGFTLWDLLYAIEEEAEEEGESSSGRFCGSLVRAYASLNMFDKAIDVYCYSLPSTRALNFLMTRLIASGKHDLVVFIFSRFGSNADADTRVLLVQAYRKLVRGLCDEKQMDAAETLVLDMEEHGIAHDVCVYWDIIQGHRKKMDFPKALQFFKDKVTQKGKRIINRVIASSILDCCCQMGKFSEAYDLFKEFRNMNVSLDRVCYNVAFDALVKLGKTEKAIQLFRLMTRKGIAPDVVNYTTLIGGCCREGRTREALDLVIEMEGKGKTPDFVMYSVLAGGLARDGDAESAYGTLKLMEARGAKPTSLTHNMVIQGLVVAGKTDEADAFYESLEHQKCWENDASFIKACCEADLLDEALERFIRLDFPLPKNVYFILFTSLCAKDDYIYIVKAQSVLARMVELGVEPGKSMYGMIIGAWCRVDNVTKARQNFKFLLSSRKIIPDKYTYTTLINTYCLVDELKEAYALFQDMKKRRIMPDVGTYTVFLNHYPKKDIKREMKALGVKPDLYYYTVVIHDPCKIGKIEKGEKIFRQMIKSGVKPDVASYTALIMGCWWYGYEDKARELIQEMLEKGMKPSECCLNFIKDKKLRIERPNRRRRRRVVYGRISKR